MSILVALAVAAVVFAASRFVVARRSVRRLGRRVEAHVQAWPRQAEQADAQATAIRRRLDEIERVLARRTWWHAFALRLERAGVDRRAVDVAALGVSVGVAATLLAAAAGSPLLALLIVVAAPVSAWVALETLAQRRVRAFDEQLPDVLAALSSSLRAGHGFLQSLQAVAADAPAPTGPELRRALAETRLGRPVEEALAGVSTRIPSKDFGYVLTAIAVQRQVGGSLAGLFETVNDTVRQRHQFARKVRTLTATGRTSAYSLVALPFAIALLMTFINHSYLVPMFESAAGRLMLLFGFASLLVGTVLVRRIVSFKG